MEQKVVIYYKNAYAHYRVTREGPGIYNAALLSYDGAAENSPCETATLLEGINRWWGCDDKELLAALSDAIVSLYQNAEYIDLRKHPVR
jgi:hypothetical protein